MDPPPFSWDSQIRPEWKSSRIDLVLSNILTFATFSLFALPSAHNNALIVGCVVSLRLLTGIPAGSRSAGCWRRRKRARFDLVSCTTTYFLSGPLLGVSGR